MNNNIEERFKINFESEANVKNSKLLRDTNKIEEYDRIKSDYLTKFSLNKYSRFAMIIGNSYMIYKFIRTKRTDYLKILLVYDSFVYLCGMMFNLK